MSEDRFVLLGLARSRAAWFADVSRWATSATIAAEFVKCVSIEEVRARLGSGRPWSAALLDGSLPAVDRDLLAALRDVACAPIVVVERGDGDRWRQLGAAAVLPAGFDRRQLVEVLAAVARPVGRPSAVVVDVADASTAAAPSLVVVVCGPGGTGVSTAAAAVAQGLAAAGHDTLLADLARHAEHALLHDVRDIVPGVQELVEAHRSGVPTAEDVRRLTFSIVDRGYALLLGLRRGRYWPLLRPRAFSAAFASLRSTFGAVVCDITADFEGESEGGSIDVEERNLPARTAVAEADVVLVVGRPGIKGVHALVRVVTDLGACGTPAGRIVPVMMGAPRSPKAKGELASTVAALARPVLGGGDMPSPLFLPSRPVDQAFRDGVALPAPLPGRLAGAVLAVVDRVGRTEAGTDEPEPVRPGTVSTFTDGA